MDFDEPSNEDPKKLLAEVASYPTDLRLRFRLGAAWLQRKKYHEAIAELQKGMGSPQVRLHSMKLLIEAFEATHMHDLAKHMREQLTRESGDEGDSGSAPVPAPTRPITPRDSSRAEKRSHEEDDV
jgi:hypothetical protein